MRIATPFALGIASALVAARAGAGERERQEARLVYTRAAAASACPDQKAVQRAVAERLGYDPFTAAADTTIAVSIAKGARGLAADVERRDKKGQSLGSRRIESEGEGCDELAGALALAISIAVDPAAAMALPAPSPDKAAGDKPAGDKPSGDKPSGDKPAPEKPAGDGAPPEKPAADKPAADKPSGDKPAAGRASPPAAPGTDAPPPAPLLFAAGAGVLGAAGAAPEVSFGLLVGVEMGRAWWSIGLEGRADLPASARLAGGGTVSTTLLQARLLPCLRWSPLFACAALSGGALSGASAGVAQPAHVTTPYLSAGLRGGAELALGRRFRLRGQLDLDAPFTRTTLRVDGAPVWTTPPLSGALSALAVISFP